MSKDAKKILLDATAGIREEYIEDAAAPVAKSHPRWVRFAAAAAVMALLLGGTLLLWPDSSPQAEYTPFFAIRAYAQDGSEATLDRTGDSSVLVSAESDLFPGKQTYMLEIYLTNTDGSKVNLADYSFYCFHRGKYLEPGDSDESLSVQFIQEDGIYGYRIIGWCEASDAATISVRNQENLIVYQRHMYVLNNGEYTTRVDSVYNYEAGIPTEKLIDKILAQNYQNGDAFQFFHCTILPVCQSFWWLLGIGTAGRRSVASAAAMADGNGRKKGYAAELSSNGSNQLGRQNAG